MEKRGVRPKGKIKIKWSSNFAYAIGLITTDGCLSKDRRHVDFTSKDFEQIVNYKKCLNINSRIGIKMKNGKKVYRVQFGDVLFFNFLLSIGLTPAKSLNLKAIKVPNKYFFDFLRGVFDGDGYSYSYFDKRWKKSFMFYVCFCSASIEFLSWIRKKIKSSLNIKGHITMASKNNSCYQLKYSKYEGIILAKALYYQKVKYFLNRKRLKINKSLYIITK